MLQAKAQKHTCLMDVYRFQHPNASACGFVADYGGEQPSRTPTLQGMLLHSNLNGLTSSVDGMHALHQ